MNRSVLAALGTLGIAFFGCALPMFQPMALPEEPIAFVYWTGPSAKKRFSIFDKAAELPPLPPGRGASDRRQEEAIRVHLRAEPSLSVHAKLAEQPGRLMLFWPRSGERTRVAAAPLGSRPLAWSADHRRLLFSSAHRGKREQLYEYHLDTKVLRRVTRGSSEHPIGTYGVDGQIVALRLRRKSNSDASEQTVHLVEAGGRFGSPVARDVPPGTIRISSTGDRLIYEQVISRRSRGGAAALESMIATQVLGGEGSEVLLLKGREPTLTPDGEWIVFASASSASYRLRRMRLDGTARVPISPGGTEERMPSVSPDGEFVAFVQLVNGYRKLAVRRFDGRREKVFLSEGWVEFPVW